MTPDRPARRVIFLLGLVLGAALSVPVSAQSRPNILLAISDDQSFPHASAYGCQFVHTPAFDRVAAEGVLFQNAFAASPGCSPCRAALLTGLHVWQLEHAGTHASSFPAKFRTYPELLAEQGYFVGMTGKGWGPGNFQLDGRQQNPAGRAWAKRTNETPATGISRKNYAANFKDFLNARPAGQPFCFWYGGHESHRPYEYGSGGRAGKDLAIADVPPFLPDTEVVRNELLDYALEIEWFDQHLGQMIELLAQAGELENTLIIVTADNGMPFPRAKANCYEYGIHMPLAIRWGKQVPAGRVVEDVVGFVDLTATILDVAGVDPSTDPPRPGRSLKALLQSRQSGRIDPQRTAAFAGRERHSSARHDNLGYPQRAMHTGEYLLIWNCRPDRWPAGEPQTLANDGTLNEMHTAYHDIDGSPTFSQMVEQRDDPHIGTLFQLAVQPRPEIELFHVANDPGCLENQTGKPEFAEIEQQLRSQLGAELDRTRDPRQLDGGEIFETYPRYSRMRSFPVPTFPEPVTPEN